VRALLKKLYLYCESIPDRFYPFTSEIEGRLVRGRESYKQAVENAFAKYGPNSLGLKLQFYRGACHFIGSVLFIVFATLISQKLFGSEVALYVLLGAAIVALFVQEFFSHPYRFQQSRRKGIVDWLTWVIPMVLYVIFWL